MKKSILFTLSICLLHAQFSVELIADDFDKPVFINSSPVDDNILYVVEQDGLIKIIENGNKVKQPFLDIRDRVHIPLFPADEMGFLSFVFHPDYSNNKKIFLHYNNRENHTIVSSMEVFESGYVNKESEYVLLKLKQPYSNHNGGSILFGQDGYLYIALGDGGSAGDPENRAQDKTNLFGSILRIDIDVENGYAIPEENPFVNNQEMCPEIWAYGLRNPWRISFDRLNGDMYIGDVGQNNWEELNWIAGNETSGKNFGWNIMEGNHCFYEGDGCDQKNLILPIFEYPNDAKYIKTILGISQKNLHGCSVTGGYVYRGEDIPDFYGRYFFGDYCTGKIWSFINIEGVVKDFQDHTQVILNAIDKKEFYLSSFGEDIRGELYIIDYNGGIYKLISSIH